MYPLPDTKREYPKPIKLPLEESNNSTLSHQLGRSSSDDSSTGIVNINPQLLSLAGGKYNVVSRSPLNVAQSVQNTKLSQIHFAVPTAKDSLMYELSSFLSKPSSLRGKAHSCENLRPNGLIRKSNMSSVESDFLCRPTVVNSEEKGDASRAKIAAYETELQTLREELTRRSMEVEQMSQELLNVKRKEKIMQSRLNDSVYTESVKEDTFHNLKDKIGELYADLESLRCAHTQALDRQVDLQEEIAALRRSCDWYAEQLRLTQSGRDKLCSENGKLQSLLQERGEINHRLTHENNCLQAQLVCAQAASATAKRNLSAQLDAIRIDMIEREAIFERFSAERASLEKLNMERAGQVSALQHKVENLQTELQLAEEQIARQRNRLNYLEGYASSADLRQTELQSKLIQIEHKHQQQLAEDQQSFETSGNYSVTMKQMEALQRVCEEKDQALTLIAEEKASLESELNAAYREKDTLNVYLEQLRKNLVRIEESFDRARCELDSKQAQLMDLADQRNSLHQQIEELKQQLSDLMKSAAQSKQEDTRPAEAQPDDCSFAAQDENSKVVVSAEVAIQTEFSTVPPAQHIQVASYFNRIDSNSVMVNVPLGRNTPTSWDFMRSEPSLATSEHPLDERFSHVGKISALYQSNVLDGQTHCLAIPTNNVANQSSETVVEQDNSDSLLKKPNRNQELYHLPGLVCQSNWDAVSGLALLSSERSYTRSSVVSTPYEGDQQSYDKIHEVSTEKSLQSAGKLAGVQILDELPTEKSCICPVSPSGMNSKTVVFGEPGLNDAVRIDLNFEAMESGLHTQAAVSHLTTETYDYPPNGVDHSSDRNTVPYDYMEHCEAADGIQSPVGVVTQCASEGCDYSEDSGPNNQPQLSASNLHYDDQFSQTCEPPYFERVALSPLNALEAQVSSCRSESINPNGDPSVGHMYQNLSGDGHAFGKTDTHEKLKDTSSVTATSARNVENHLHDTVGPCVPNIVNRAENVQVKSAFGAPSVIASDEHPFMKAPSKNSLMIDASGCFHNGIDRIPGRDALLEALNEANQKAAEAISNLLAAQKETEVQNATIERETRIRQQAVKAHQQTVLELNATRTRLNELQSELESLRNQTQNLRTESTALRERQNACTSAHALELEALRSIIKATTDHVASMSLSLKKANEDKLQLQKELAHIKGGIRAQLERYRLFGPTKSVDWTGEENQTNSMTSVSLDVHKLESLIGENTTLPVFNSKPLTGLNKCFDTLQMEISSLEEQIVQHAIAVRNCVNGSVKSENEVIPAADGVAQFCDREP
ncbi:unnamed protein product [Echinostoma caproni]|uniref:Uncharacterized protein n=1 Tax=Echinostoma caproni TaxID=27848 RepID=A0A183AUT1_9TREM|nr:unnamed protein product [Echinostoma caproni]